MDKQRTADEIPLGFAMSLAQNASAMRKYALMDEDERTGVNERAAHAHSKSEMRSLVNEIAQRSDIG